MAPPPPKKKYLMQKLNFCVLIIIDQHSVADFRFYPVIDYEIHSDSQHRHCIHVCMIKIRIFAHFYIVLMTPLGLCGIICDGTGLLYSSEVVD